MGYDYKKINDLIKQGKTIPEISLEINGNKKYLYEILKKKNIKINKVSKNNYIEVIKLNEEGKTILEISQICNIKEGTIRAFFYRNGIKANENNGKLTGYSFFPINEHKAYLLGIIYGDGTLGKYKKEVTISMNDLDVLEKINKYVFDNKIDIGNRVLKSGKIHYTLGIYNSNIWEELKKIGLNNNKASTLKWPKLNNNLIRHFIRGLVDSDGSFYLENDNKLVFAYGSCSKDFIEKLKEQLILNCKVNKTKTSIIKSINPCYLIRWNNKKDGLNIGKWIYKNSLCKSDRKYDIWNKYRRMQALKTGDTW